MAAVAASRPRRMSAQDVHDSTRHVSRHKRLRHSTITSLTSLPDISGVCMHERVCMCMQGVYEEGVIGMGKGSPNDQVN